MQSHLWNAVILLPFSPLPFCMLQKRFTTLSQSLRKFGHLPFALKKQPWIKASRNMMGEKYYPVNLFFSALLMLREQKQSVRCRSPFRIRNINMFHYSWASLCISWVAPINIKYANFLPFKVNMKHLKEIIWLDFFLILPGKCIMNIFKCFVWLTSKAETSSQKSSCCIQSEFLQCSIWGTYTIKHIWRGRLESNFTPTE